MSAFLIWKVVHVISAALLFGTGLGIAFFMWRADRSGEVRLIAAAARGVVIADTYFTFPAVVLQPASGYALMRLSGWDFGEPWLWAAALLYVFAGACWLPVVGLQLRVRNLAQAALAQGTPLPASYRTCMRWWYALGWPAFAAVVAVYALMIAKPASF